MAKRVVTPEQFLDAAFPMSGVDTSSEFWRQADKTAVFAKNVRTEEPVGQNDRGGQRMGLSRYVNALVGTANLIQNLDVIVDPQAPALSGDNNYPGGFTDPSTNNNAGGFGDRNPPTRVIRPGGSGAPPNRNLPTPSAQSIAFVQQKGTGFGNVTGGNQATQVFDGAITNQNVAVVFVATDNSAHLGNTNVGVTVTNGGATAYTQIGTYVTVAGLFGSQLRLSAWYKILNSGVDDNTIQVTPGATVIVKVAAIEYVHASSTSPIANNVSASNAGPSGTFSAGALTLNNTTGQLVVAAFVPQQSSTQTAASGYTPRFNMTGAAGFISGELCVEDRSGLSGVGPETPTMTVSTAQGWLAFAVGLTR